MSDRDVHPDDMFHDDPLLSEFARSVREAADRAPLPAVNETLAAVLEGRAPATSYPEVEPPAPVRRLRGPTFRLRLGLAALGAAAAVAVLASVGTLPDPAQRQVARLASFVGLDLPDGDGEGDADETPAEPTTTSTTSTTVPTTTNPTGAPATTPPTSAAPAPTTTLDDGDNGRGNDDRDEDDDNSGRGNDGDTGDEDEDEDGDDRPRTTTTTERRDENRDRDEDDDEDSTGPGRRDEADGADSRPVTDDELDELDEGP